MRYIKAATSLILLGLFLIFSGQNNNLVEFKFLKFQISQIPLFVIIIIVFVMGVILGRITGWFSCLFDYKKEKKYKNKD